MMNFSPIRFETYFMEKYVQLFSQCFPAGSKFNINYLDWLYRQNPNGLAIGFDAWDGDKLAAHYVLIPIDANIAGLKMRVLLSLNTATHPNYQGRGLFVNLAERTYAVASGLGFGAVYGIANANSTPGFTRKLGFQFLGPLDAKVGFGSLSIDLDRVEKESQFRTCWTKDSIEWRCLNPNNLVKMTVRDNRLKAYAPAIGRGLLAYAEIVASKELESKYVLEKSVPSSTPLRLYLGLSPVGTMKSKTYVDIPSRLRPSPLNFIYKSLNESIYNLELRQISITFLDFDAY
jgi:hypothetical protein